MPLKRKRRKDDDRGGDMGPKGKGHRISLTLKATLRSEVLDWKSSREWLGFRERE